MRLALRQLHGPVLIGEPGGRPAAALSVSDGRSVTNPFQPHVGLVAHLRMRAGALRAFERMPSFAARMRARRSQSPSRDRKGRRSGPSVRYGQLDVRVTVFDVIGMPGWTGMLSESAEVPVAVAE
jgi:hypothetical protein